MNLSVDLLVIHNDEDDVVDPTQAPVLLAAYGSRARFLQTSGPRSSPDHARSGGDHQGRSVRAAFAGPLKGNWTVNKQLSSALWTPPC